MNRSPPPTSSYILRVQAGGRSLVFELIDLRSGERTRLAGVRALWRWFAARRAGLR